MEELLVLLFSWFVGGVVANKVSRGSEEPPDKVSRGSEEPLDKALIKKQMLDALEPKIKKGFLGNRGKFIKAIDDFMCFKKPQVCHIFKLGYELSILINDDQWIVDCMKKHKMDNQLEPVNVVQMPNQPPKVDYTNQNYQAGYKNWFNHGFNAGAQRRA